MADEMPEIEQIQAYTPKPGDVLFVRLPENTPPQTCKQAKDQLERNIPGVLVVILTGEIEIGLPAGRGEPGDGN